VSVMMRMGNDIMASTYSTSLKKYNFKLSCWKSSTSRSVNTWVKTSYW
jgi:hypothetical protein